MDKDKETIQKNEKSIEKLKRRLIDMDEVCKNQKTQSATLNQNLVNLQNDVGFKVDRDTFEQAVHSK